MNCLGLFRSDWLPSYSSSPLFAGILWLIFIDKVLLSLLISCQILPNKLIWYDAYGNSSWVNFCAGCQCLRCQLIMPGDIEGSWEIRDMVLPSLSQSKVYSTFISRRRKASQLRYSTGSMLFQNSRCIIWEINGEEWASCLILNSVTVLCFLWLLDV